MKILLALILLTTAQLTLAQQDSIVSDAELERWLNTYATPAKTTQPDTTSADTTNILTPDTTSLPTPSTTKPHNVHSFISNAFSKNNETIPTPTTKHTTSTKPATSTKPTPLKVNRRWRQIILRQLTETEKQTIITPEDSLIIHIEALHSSSINPLFDDWIFGAKPQRSMSLTNADSTIISLRNNAEKHIRLTAPQLYDYHISQLPKSTEIKSRRINQSSADQLILQSNRLTITATDTISIDLPELPRWNYGAKFQVQASQNYISPNWYKGGESNLTGNIYAMAYCNYNNRRNIQWDNKLEWKLGINSTGADTLRKVNTNDDLLRLNSKVGVKAFKSFFYTAEFDFQTTLFNTYRAQTYIRSSGPFSPIRTTLSLGIDYKYKNKLSVFVSPLSYKLVYVADSTHHPSVKPNETIPYIIGITDGTRTLNQLGALLRLGWEHRFNESIELEIKYSLFGNYVGLKKGIETDLEIIGNFRINRFLSSKISINPRYDSTVRPADGSKPKLQFRELISVGFNYVI